jgi:ATP synthase protein I
VNSPDELPEQAASPEATASTQLPPEPNASMQEFYQLQQNLLVTTLVATGIIFLSVWVFYSLAIALNYLLGATTGVVYLRLLAKNVERLGRQSQKVGSSRLALLIALILVASQWNQLQIMPIFLGFLTYKAALIIYVLWTSFSPRLD